MAVDNRGSSLIEVEDRQGAAESALSRSAGLRTFFSRLRSYFILGPLIFFYTFLLGSASFLISFFDPTGRRQHALARTWSRWILATAMSPVTVVGLEHIDVSQPAIYAANHISALDIPVLYANLPFQFRILAKKELFRYPFIGGHLKRSGQFPIDETNARASIRSLAKAIESLQARVPLMIFPEGGRAADGHITPFMSGAFYAAIKAQVPVVPMAIVGTFETLPMNTYHIQPRPLQLLIGKPISSNNYTLRQMDALAAEVQSVIEDMYYSHAHVPDPRRDRGA